MDKDTIQFVFVSRANEDTRNSIYRGTPTASFFLHKDGSVSVAKHIKETPLIVTMAKKGGLYNPFLDKNVTIDAGKDFIVALLWHLKNASYLTMYVLQNNKMKYVDIGDKGELIIY